MAVPYELRGRRAQKRRTRGVLVAAARALLARGIDPTVEQAAEEASVSRTTAYRYFPNQRALLVATYPEIEAESLLGTDPPTGVEERLDLVTRRIGEQLLDHEPELRATLRISLERSQLDHELPLRTGRAVGWIEDALAPLREQMGETKLRRLALAIRATFGIEALVWLTDVAGLSRTEAVKLMRSSAMTLLRAAVAGL